MKRVPKAGAKPTRPITVKKNGKIGLRAGTKVIRAAYAALIVLPG